MNFSRILVSMAIILGALNSTTVWAGNVALSRCAGSCCTGSTSTAMANGMNMQLPALILKNADSISKKSCHMIFEVTMPQGYRLNGITTHISGVRAGAANISRSYHLPVGVFQTFQQKLDLPIIPGLRFSNPNTTPKIFRLSDNIKAKGLSNNYMPCGETKVSVRVVLSLYSEGGLNMISLSPSDSSTNQFQIEADTVSCR